MALLRLYLLVSLALFLISIGHIVAAAESADIFSPRAGTYQTALSVVIKTATARATVRYTIDGTTPSEAVGIIYTDPVNISENITLKAVAYKSGMRPSGVATATYYIQCAAPTFSPVPGPYTSAQTVTISCATIGAAICYTTDGSTPSPTHGTRGTTVTITGTTTLKAIAYKTNLTDSAVASATYTLTSPNYEGDVAPRPGGNGTLTVADWVQVGRFAIGLDTPSSESEFQRADCAPITTRGDGRISVADWVQASRYAAALDPLTVAGGPTQQVAGSGQLAQIGGSNPHVNRTISMQSAPFTRGKAGTVQVLLTAQGDENALGFSLHFDPKRLQFFSARAIGMAAAATCNINTRNAAAGDLGIGLMLPQPRSFVKGRQPLVELTFLPLASCTTTLAFGNQIATCEIASATAAILSAGYQNALVQIRK